MKTLPFELLRCVLFGVCLFAGFYLLILARASQLFQSNNPVAVAAAVRLQPHNSTYLDRLASWRPDNSEALLNRAVAENPLNSEAWLHLGFLAEMHESDPQKAEKFYLKAAEVNHMFLPRWTLTNFYFRQQNIPEFFQWSRATLEITPYASDPVFAQMREVTTDDNTIDAAIPNRPRILLQYAWFLSKNKQFNSIPRVVNRLLDCVGKDDPDKWGRNDLLAASLDEMLAAEYTQPALDVWSSLVHHGWLYEATPSVDCPITNNSFERRSYGHGFAWVLHRNDGVRMDPPIRLTFSGNEAEHLILMQRYVPLAPATRYSLTWNLEATSISAPDGFTWQLHAPSDHALELTSGDLLGATRQWQFQTPPSTAPVNTWLLRLEYLRPLGVTRPRGTLHLKSVALTKAP